MTALLPAVTVALAGVPVHVITVNAYLATRDANELAAVYGFFGLRVGLLVPEMEAADRTRAYGCEVTYCVNKDLVFDYLRDSLRYQRGVGRRASVAPGMVSGKSAGADGETLLRGLFYAIVDEADSVLIDEARTPLIISRDVADPYGRTLYEEALAIAASLDLGEHFQVRGRERSDGVIDRPFPDSSPGQVKLAIRNPPLSDWKPEQLPSRVRQVVSELQPSGNVTRINIRTGAGPRGPQL